MQEILTVILTARQEIWAAVVPAVMFVKVLYVPIAVANVWAEI